MAGPNTGGAVMNVVARKDAETAVRVAYATGRRDAMTTLAKEMEVLAGQFIGVDDMVEAITKAAIEFQSVIDRLEAGDQPVDPPTPEAEAAAKARERIILPS